ncbi:hypothetical protein BDZ94DRAFT_1254799 [Collybia nuda]|uniref:Uncharacterized protein n=1 Tax=Collybia nuda TaxID=64659 RepID=A0A9P5YAQ1_9AGAR|nr:hypothetical protein BDZ94DRAFT_1254799 [Collybia nuda]
MAPTLQIISDGLAKRSASSSGDSSTITIVCAVVGGVLLLLILCVIFVRIARRRHLRRRAEVASANDSENRITSRFEHRNSSVPLLKEDPYWKPDESADHNHRRSSYSYSLKEIQFQDQEPTTFALDSTPFMAESLTPEFYTRSSLPRLTIPERTSLLDASENVYFTSRASIEPSAPESPTSTSSNDSVSLYSQPSASAHTPQTSSFPSLPMTSLQRLPTRLVIASAQEEDAAPKRSDTTMVANMLRSRAERNPKKPTRSASQVSHIERAGSIKPAESLIDPPGSYRRRLGKKFRNMTTASMESLAEVLDSAAPSAASVTPTLSTPQWQYPILPAQPPPSLRTTNPLERASPPHDPIALIPMVPHDGATGDVSGNSYR